MQCQIFLIIFFTFSSQPCDKQEWRLQKPSDLLHDFVLIHQRLHDNPANAQKSTHQEKIERKIGGKKKN